VLGYSDSALANGSFYSKYPGVLEEVYRALLALAPSEKILHGSDAIRCRWKSATAAGIAVQSSPEYSASISLAMDGRLQKR
jgi:hypothetical protein